MLGPVKLTILTITGVMASYLGGSRENYLIKIYLTYIVLMAS